MLTIVLHSEMEKAVLRLGNLKAHLHLRLVQTCKYHSSLIKVKKYRLLENGRITVNSKTFTTQVFGQLRKEASPAKPAEAPPAGTPYSKLSIGVPKEQWKDEKRCFIFQFWNLLFLYNLCFFFV